MDLDAIVFDLDNTLLDRTKAVRRWLLDHCRLPPSLLEEALDVDDLGYAERDRFNGWVSEHTEVGSLADVYCSYRECIGECIERDEQVVELLRRLSRRFRVGILTNGLPETQRPKLDALGVTDVLAPHAIVIAGDLGVLKPDARPFEAILERLGVRQPHRALYVGDNPWHDVEGARAVGMLTCWIAHGRVCPVHPPPDLQLDTLFEIESRLAGIRSPNIAVERDEEP